MLGEDYISFFNKYIQSSPPPLKNKFAYLSASPDVFRSNLEHIPPCVALISPYFNKEEFTYPVVTLRYHRRFSFPKTFHINQTQFLPYGFMLNHAKTQMLGKVFALINTQSEEDCRFFVENNPFNIGYIRNQTSELCKLAVKLNPLAFAFIRDPDLSELLEANSDITELTAAQMQKARDDFDSSPLKICFQAFPDNLVDYALKHPTVIGALPQTEEFCFDLINRDPYLIAYIHEPSDELCKVAISKTWNAFGLLAKQSREVKQYAITKQPANVLYCQEITEEDVTLAMGLNQNIAILLLSIIVTLHNRENIVETILRCSPQSINFLDDNNTSNGLVAWLKMFPECIPHLNKNRSIRYWGYLLDNTKDGRRYYNQLKDLYPKDIIGYLSDNYDLIRFYGLKKDTIELIAKERESAIMFLRDVSEEEGLRFIEEDVENLRYIRNQTVKQCLAASLMKGFSLKYARIQTEEICLNALNLSGSEYIHVREQTEKINLKAVELVYSNIRHVRNPSREVCLLAIERNFKAIKYIDEPTEEYCFAALDKNYTAFRYIENPSKNVMLHAIGLASDVLKLIEDQTEELCMTAMLSQENQIHANQKRKRATRLKFIKDEGMRKHISEISNGFRPIVRTKSARASIVPTF